MKITAIETLVCNARMRNWIFVKIETDEGLVGWGEGKNAAGSAGQRPISRNSA